MAIAGVCELVGLGGNALAAVLMHRTGRVGWLVVPVVGVGVAMVNAVIQAYAKAARQRRLTQWAASRRAQRDKPRVRPDRHRPRLGLGGLALSEGTRHVVSGLPAVSHDSTPTSPTSSRRTAKHRPHRASRAHKQTPLASAPDRAPARYARVPDVSGKTGMGAWDALGDAGFSPRGDFEPSSSVPFGHVTRTDPPAGTELRKGQPVTFYTSAAQP
jgi:hypothetical protein